MGLTSSSHNNAPAAAATVSARPNMTSTPVQAIPDEEAVPVTPRPGTTQSLDRSSAITPSSKNIHISTSSLSKLFRSRKKWKPKRRGSISASFNLHESEIQMELLNVNTATEEELMTLTGVNRTLARNIVNHRQIIGCYRIVEDVALVSGMGATKLDMIKPEICVSKKKNLSRASSKTASMDSIPSSEFGRVVINRPIKVLNVNTATIFDLMTIHGINQALAARIITYRDRKGPYKTLDDLRSIRISPNRLGAIRAYLTTEDFECEKNSTNSHSTPSRSICQNSSTKGLVMSASNPVIRSELGRTSPGPVNPPDDMKVIYELLSIKSNRPRRDPEFLFEFNNQAAYRIGTWNLENMIEDKIANPGVLEVLTRTILETGLSIVAVQEICDKGVLAKICDELNDPRISRIREWKQKRGTWKFILHDSPLHFDKKPHYLGILYNAEQIDDIRIPDSAAAFTPIQNGSLWQFAIFTVKTTQSEWLLINVLASPLNSGTTVYTNGHSKTADQESVTTLLKSLVKDIDGAIILGYFNAQQAKKGLGSLDDLDEIFPETNENVNPDSTRSSLWVTRGLKGFVTGESGIITEGLTHLAIPNGWGWGGRATESSPLWCTLYRDRQMHEST